MEMDIRSLLKPRHDFLGFVCAVVIQNDVQVEAFRMMPVNLPQERQKLLGTGSRGHFADHAAGQNIESRVQAGGAVTLVVTRAATNPARAER